MRWITLILLMLVLAACGSDDDKPSTPQPDDNGNGSAPATLAPVVVDLQQDYESLRVAQQAIGDVWEKLAADQEVQCGSYPDVLSPDAISAGDDSAYQPLADALRRAAMDIDHAVSIWKAECANPRRFPPPDVINEGRLAARSAGDALREAETLLAEIQ
jgi:hypothetical protein